jgi:hypothetical protein
MAAASTLAVSSRDTIPLVAGFSTRDTVDACTPQRRAISLMVVGAFFMFMAGS